MKAFGISVLMVVGVAAGGAACSPAKQPEGRVSTAPPLAAEPTSPVTHSEDAGPAPSPGDAPPAAAAAAPQNERAAEYELTLSSSGETCVLTAQRAGTSSQLPLALKPPCWFVRRGGKALRIERYDDLRADVVMVMGDPKVVERQGKPFCDGLASTGLQAVLLGKHAASIAPAMHNFSPVCPSTEMDEKDFWIASHSRAGR